MDRDYPVGAAGAITLRLRKVAGGMAEMATSDGSLAPSYIFIPAKAGTQCGQSRRMLWVPAFAGMTNVGNPPPQPEAAIRFGFGGNDHLRPEGDIPLLVTPDLIRGPA
jgi:hypothetical protein